MAIQVQEARLLPLQNLRIPAAGEGPDHWVAENSDPQCEIVFPSAGAAWIPGGWYVLDVRLEDIEGQFVSPRLYPDYGHGWLEEQSIFLPDPSDGNRVCVLVRFSHPVRRLRFDPSCLPFSFRPGQISLRRVGRIDALVRMVRDVHDLAEDECDGRWKRTLRFASGVLRQILLSGPRRGGDHAYTTYVALLKGPDRGEDYRAWVRRYDLPQHDRHQLMQRVKELPRRPLISVLVPVYNTPEKWLRRCIDSVLNQAYPHWELCIADDASSAPRVRHVLQEYQAMDARIKVAFREKNGHISASSNTALELVSGEYVALLDHDDELPPHALLEVAEAICRNPQWKLIFSDEDKIDGEGNRFDPYFKPDWNYDLFLSHNCISHFGVYETQLVRDVDGFREGTEGSQDWDLALRCIERLETGQIGHIAKVLYHWRAIAGSTALAPGEKNYAHLAAMRVIQDHLDRQGIKGTVEELPTYQGNYRVRYQVPKPEPLVSLIIPTRDRVDLLRQCVDSILEKTTYANFEIVIVDNQSRERETLAYLDQVTLDPRVSVIKYDAPFNYSKINNEAVSACRGALLGFVNNDIEVITPGWLDEMASHAMRQGVGAVGAKLYYPNDTIQHAGVILGFNGVGVHAYGGRHRSWLGQMLRAKLIQQFSAVTAACMVVKRTAFEEVGGFDERLQVAYNDVDLCLRLGQAGYKNVWTPFAELYHHESASRGSDMTLDKRDRFEAEVKLMMDRWRPIIERDPAYNVNLANSGDSTFHLAFPPRGESRGQQNVSRRSLDKRPASGAK